MTQDLDPPRRPEPGELDVRPRRAAASRRATSPTSPRPSVARPSPGSVCRRSAPTRCRRHYFARLSADPEAWTDIPAAQRADLARAAHPDAHDARARAHRRQGHHAQDAVAPARRRAGRERAHALPGPRHDVRLEPGRLRHELPVLRHRPGRAHAQHEHRRDRRAGRGRCAPARRGRGPRRAGPRVQRRVHGHGRAAGQLQGRHRRASAGSPTPAPAASACRRAASRCRPSVSCRASASSPPRACRSRSRCRCTPPTTSCATPSCPVNTRWKVAEVLDAAWEYAEATKRRVSIEYALIKDINDQAWRADLLAKRLRGKLVHVNLIPLNPTPGSKWTASRPEDEREFVRRLEAGGIAGHRARHPRPRDRRGVRAAGGAVVLRAPSSSLVPRSSRRAPPPLRALGRRRSSGV